MSPSCLLLDGSSFDIDVPSSWEDSVGDTCPGLDFPLAASLPPLLDCLKFEGVRSDDPGKVVESVKLSECN